MSTEVPNSGDDATAKLLKAGQEQHLAKALLAKQSFKPSQDNLVQAKRFSPEIDIGWRIQASTKLVHFVRHGQGYHNLLGEVVRSYGVNFQETGDYDIAVQENCPYMLKGILDPPLTSIGRADARRLREGAAKGLQPELYVTSPMKRAAQTVLLGFLDDLQDRPEVPVVANEDVREQLGVFLCDQRSPLSELTEEYERVDFSLMTDEADTLWQQKKRETMLDMGNRSDRFLEWLYNRPEKEIVVGTHSAWLMCLTNVVLDVPPDHKELGTMFATGEMRSMVLTWPDRLASKKVKM